MPPHPADLLAQAAQINARFEHESWAAYPGAKHF
jgi:hypothetical protein